jgi:hypothetical protein
MVSQVIGAVASTVASKFVGKLFGDDKPSPQIAQPQLPEPAPVAEAPVRGGQASQAAQRIAMQRARKRGGREEQQLTTLSSFGGGGTLG